MSNIELVLTDIDGTLVEINKHDPTAAVREALRNVQAAGVTVTAATGRPYDMSGQMFAELGLHGPSIFDAGASIRDVDTGELLWKNWLDVKRIRAIATIVLPHSTTVDFFPFYREVSPDELKPEDATEDAPYVFAFVKEAAFADVYERLKAIAGIKVNVGPGRPDAPGLRDLQITDSNSSKFHAVNELRKLVHSSKDHTLAIGDSDNDLPLFENAGLTVAMGNATDSLKAIANHIVGSIEEDGFAEAMQRFVLH